MDDYGVDTISGTPEEDNMTRSSCVLVAAALTTLFISSSLAAQSTGPLWTKTFGDGGIAHAYSICRTSDGGFAVAGKFKEKQENGWDVYLVKMDSAGDTMWTRSYGGPGDEVARRVIETGDGGFFIAGRTQPVGVNTWNIYLLKTAPDGGGVWIRTYGRTEKDFAMSVIQTADGGCLLAGGTMGADGETYDICLVKTDSDGNEIWTRSYGGVDGEFATSVAETRDGGYIVAACTESFGEGSLDVYLIKTDGEGKVIWTRTYGGEGWDMPWDIRQTSDGGFIVAGETESYGADGLDVYLLRVGGDGEPLWVKNYGGQGRETARAVWETPQGDFIVGGSTHAYEEWGRDIYIARVDARGEVLWVKSFGGPGHDAAHSIMQALDGACIVAGEMGSPDSGKSDACVLKVQQ